jgi:hypothetical protein
MTYPNTTYRNTERYDRGTRWQDPTNLVLAAWLFISPWVLGFAYNGVAAGAGTVAAWDAWVLGVVVFLVGLSAMGQRFVRGQEWVNLALGVWIFIAPWVLGFAYGGSDAAWDHWIVGALIFLVSASGVANTRSLSGQPEMQRR